MNPRLLAFLAPLACSSGPPPTDYTSGTRLRAEIYVAESGAKQFHGLFDTQRDEACAFRPADDGLTRCLPTSMTLVAETGSTVFADAACTQPVISLSVSPQPSYVGVLSGCSISVYERGAPVGTTYATTNGTCHAIGSADPSSMFTLGAKIAASSFVAAQLTREPRGAALSMQFWTADDGTRAPIGAFDVARHGSCGSIDGMEDRCAPLHVDFPSLHLFSDKACTTPLTLAYPNPLECSPYAGAWYAADDPATVVGLVSPDPAHPSCPTASVPSFSELAPTTPLPPVYIDDGPGACSPGSASGNMISVGAPVPTSSLPAIVHAHAGAGRLVERVQTAATGERLFVEDFFDTQLAAPCRAVVAEDGALRCLPETPFAPEYSIVYADAQCTAPILVDTYAGCDLPPFGDELLEFPDGSYRMRVVQTGAPITPPATTYELTNSTRCIVFGTVTTSSYFTATIVSPDTFAALTDVTE